MATPAHTPYDGSATPFTIGLKPLDLDDWLEVDGHYAEYLDEKDRLIRERTAEVFAAETGTEEAQAETLDLVAGHLGAHLDRLFPGEAERTLAASRMADWVRRDDEPALQRAARLIQEDLVLMRHGSGGWRLAAASLCFPSSWTLAEKFGRPLADIHAPVPGFGEGTRPAALIERMFDRLQGQAVQRQNWSLQPDMERFKPRPSHDRRETGGAGWAAPGEIADAAFIRVERQTLRKLPRSGDILFTIRIHLDPLRALAAHPERARLAGGLADQLAALDAAQLRYKGLAAARDRLLSALRAMAEGRA